MKKYELISQILNYKKKKKYLKVYKLLPYVLLNIIIQNISQVKKGNNNNNTNIKVFIL